MTRWLETDTISSVDISTAATPVGAYTADADRQIFAQFYISCAGNGDYIFWMTLQVGGSGSEYRIQPRTTAAVASGATAIAGQSTGVNVRSGDILRIYIDGLAGDTSVSGAVRWFELAALRPTTADRTLDVSAGGEAGLDWANVGSPTTSVGLSNTTVGLVTTVTSVTNGVTLADDAITSEKFDESTAFPLKAADSGSTYVARTGADSDTLKTLSDQLDAAASEATSQAIKAVTDAIDLTDINYVSSYQSGVLRITRGVTFEQEVTGVTIPADWTWAKLYCKRDANMKDAYSKIYLLETNPGDAGDGLQLLGAQAPVAPITNADGGLVVDQPGSSVTITLTDEATGALGVTANGAWYLRFGLSDGSVVQRAAGAFHVVSV